MNIIKRKTTADDRRSGARTPPLGS